MARAPKTYGWEPMAFNRLMQLVAASIAVIWISAGPTLADPYRIVGFGDSLMAGYQLAAGESVPEKLETALKAKGHDVVIVNAGVSGDTTTGGLARLDWSVPDDTDLVILELGANDMLRGIAPEVTENNLEAMIERLRDRDVGIVLAGMLAAPNLGPDFAARFDAIYPRLADEYGLTLYPFFLDGVAAERHLLLDDGMHPNADGVDRIVEGLVPVVESMLPPPGTDG